MSGIVYAGGGWVTNIGNSFYNLGVLHALEIAGQGRPIYFMPDITPWMFKDAVAYDPIGDVDADLWVFSGPGFSSGILHYKQLFDQLRARDKRIAFHSVGLWQYTDREWDLVRSFLEPYVGMIDFISTRDRRTFERVQGLRCPTFDGICGSMFLPEAVTVPQLNRSPYVVLNFPKPSEPVVSIDEAGQWQLQFPASPAPATGRIRALLTRVQHRLAPSPQSDTGVQTSVGGFDIVRTQSEKFKDSAARVFDRATMHYSDLPTGYLAIYRSAEVVLTDRVHTAAATLVLGGTAQYFMTTDRARDGRWLLLDRVGAADVTSRPARLDLESIAKEKAAQLDFLRQVIG